MDTIAEVDLDLCYPSPCARTVDRKAVAALAESIAQVGLMQPITVRRVQKYRVGILSDAYEVIAGLHRVKAFRRLGRTHIPAAIIDADDLRAELMLIDENLQRNDLTPAEKAAAQARRKAIWQELHPETKPTKDGGPGRAKTRGKLCHESVSSELASPADRYDEAAAKASGESARKVRLDVHRGEALGADALARVARTCLDKGEELDALAKLATDTREELIARAAAGEKVSAKTEAKKARRAVRESELAEKQCALPQARYGVIYADPEWRFEPRSRETGMDRAADNHYPTSTTDDICARDIGSIAGDDCALFLWATAPMLPDALRVMAAWGFVYKTHLIWNKMRAGNGRGTGYWVTGEHELLLIGTRGRIPAPAVAMCGSVVDAPWQGRHSAKPEIFADIISRVFPTLPKIELNRRGPPRPGWAAWGNEAEPAGGDEVASACRSEADAEVGGADESSSIGEPAEGLALIRRSESGAASDPVLPAGSPIDDDALLIPNFLRRDADNRPPWTNGSSPDASPRPASVTAAAVEQSEAAPAAAFSSHPDIAAEAAE